MREAPIVPRKAHVESRPMSAAVLAVADMAAVAAEDWILIVMVMAFMALITSVFCLCLCLCVCVDLLIYSSM